MRRWLIGLVGVIAVCAVAIGVANAATSMSHGVTWGIEQGVKAVFDFLTWAIVVALFLAGGLLLVRYSKPSRETH